MIFSLGWSSRLLGVSLLALAISPGNLRAAYLQLDFEVQWIWRFDLAAEKQDEAFVPFVMPLRVYADPSFVGTNKIGESTRLIFGSVLFISPFSQHIDMGVDVSAGLAPSASSHGFVQDTYITEANQGTWTNLTQTLNFPLQLYSFNLQHTADTRLADPSSFGSPDYVAHLFGHVGDVFRYREDTVTATGGWQNLGDAKLLAVTPVSVIPEPAEIAAVLASMVAVAAILLRRASRRSNRVFDSCHPVR